MISNVLIVVSLVVILLGIVGIKERSVKKRMVALTFSTVGGLGIAFSQMGQYGLLSGLQQLPFRGVGLLFLWLLVSDVCKKNQITMLDELNGIRRFAPYTYTLIVFVSLMLIGVPGTGTFTGVMYAQMGYMYGYSGVFSYIGMLGNVLAMIAIAVIVFPILREAFLFERKDRQDKKSEEKPMRTRANLVKPAVALQTVTLVVVVGMIVLSVWQGVLTSAVTKIVESMM